MNYEEAWKLIKLIAKNKRDESDNPDRKFAYGHILGLMESMEKENPDQ